MEVLTVSLVFSALLAGILTFLAPCTLPLIPAFIGYLSGLREAEAGHRGNRYQVLLHTAAYCLGFSVMFILFGLLAGLLGGWLTLYQTWLLRIGGVFVVLVGLSMLGVRWMPSSWQRSSTATITRREPSPLVAFGIGTAFALGWSPCIGPLLATILLYASTTATAMAGAVLLGIFSIGLAIPFLLTALVYERASRVFSQRSGTIRRLQQVGGWTLIILGVALLTNSLSLLFDIGYWLFTVLGFESLYRFF
jgi:cytochrome c-type biogenesis protein